MDVDAQIISETENLQVLLQRHPLNFVGYSILLRSNLLRHFQVFYPYNMKEGSNFTICHGNFDFVKMFTYLDVVGIVTADESWRCSDGLLYDLSVYDHLHYFNIDVSKYGEDGCIGAAVAPPRTYF